MKSKLLFLLKSNAVFAIIIYILVTSIAVVTVLSFNFIKPVVITIVAVCLYFLSGIFLSKRNVSLLSLLTITLLISLFGIFDFLNLYLFNPDYDQFFAKKVHFLFVNYSDPYQGIQTLHVFQGTPLIDNRQVSETIWILQKANLLPSNEVMEIELVILLSFLSIILMYSGKIVLGNIHLTKKTVYLIFAVILTANIYVIYNPNMSVEYEYNGPFGYTKEELIIRENGNYYFIQTHPHNGTKREVKFELTKKEMRKKAFNVVYKNMFFRLRPHLSKYVTVLDGDYTSLTIKWFGNSREVYGLCIESLNFIDIESNLKDKVEKDSN